MDNLVLTRLALELRDSLAGSVLEDFRQESGERFRLVFAASSTRLPLLISLRPELPWIGCPAFRWDGPIWSPDPFAVTAARALVGRRVTRVSKEPCDRVIRIDFGAGGALVAELVSHRVNLILLDGRGDIEASLKHPKGSAEELSQGRPWSPRALPEGKLDPFAATPHDVDAVVLSRARDGYEPVDVLRRDFLGVGSNGAELVLRESAAGGETPGSVLRRRLDALLIGDAEVVIEGSGDPRVASDRGTFSAEHFHLLPWRPSASRAGAECFTVGTVSGTAGLFHEALERAERTRGRVAALGAILRGELRRTRDAERKVREGVRSFVDPERFARMGEALLAGLSSARRSGDTVLVPDPYDPEGRPVEIPATPGLPLTQVANDLFARGRRAKRGAATAAERAETLAARGGRLESLLLLHERAGSVEEAAALEEAMRGEKLAVGLARPTRAARAAALASPPKLEGVRMIASSDGWTILVGRTGKDNDRLTFKIAAPDDFWLHASGVPGAHVVIRNPDKKASVPETTLREAARAAAWFSDRRSDGMVEVQWTRRKYVRRARGSAAGRVILKRFEAVQVRPQAPPERD